MPYWRLSSFYFFYFAVLGALLPYWGLLLQSRGFSATAIGELMAILLATKIIAPNIWGWLGDHLGHRMVIVRVASLLSAIVFIAMFQANSFWSIALVMTLYSFFWNASLPQLEVVTFNYLAGQVARYAQIRVWGSIGFIISVLLLGIWIDAVGPEIILSVVMFLFISIWISVYCIDDPQAIPHPQQQEGLLKVLKRPAILLFFAIVLLMQMSHGAYYTFYSIYMEGYGYSKAVIGQLWALGVLAEVILLLLMHRLLQRWDAGRLLLISLLLATVRWLMIAYLPDSLFWLVLAQCLHAATFGIFHAAAIHLVHYYFRGRLQGRGQALYASMSFGVGGALGSLGSGYLWEPLGAQYTFTIAAGVALLGVVLAWILRAIDSAAGDQKSMGSL